MDHAKRGCPRCRSAGSVSNGSCEVCLTDLQPTEPRPVRLGTAFALGILKKEPVAPQPVHA